MANEGSRRFREIKYFPQEDLKEKYRGRTDRIKVYCKSVVNHESVEQQLHINCEERQHGIIYIVVEAATRQAAEKAMLYVAGEFCTDGHKRRHGIGTTPTPHRGRSGPREAAKVVQEQTQRKLHSEGERCIPLTEDALRRHDLKTSCELRQFACGPCDNPWWRTVSICKLVSKCRQCGVRYDALERDRVFGIGRFTCHCDNTFYAKCQATDSRPCHKCGDDVEDPYIHPKFKQRPHLPKPHFYPVLRQPGLRRPRVINASTPHDSTGSTLSTFLTQWDKASEYVDLDYGSDFDDGSDGDDQEDGAGGDSDREFGNRDGGSDNESSSNGDDSDDGDGKHSRVGICSFKCPKCHHTFTVRCRLSDTADCHKCGNETVKPHSWSPLREIKHKTNNKHSCSACMGMGHCPNFAE